jgi:hypothetical protein
MTTTTPDSHVADAINRVLAAEHTAAAAIVSAQAAAQAEVEAARERRRDILEKARQRVIRLHEGAQSRLASRLAQLDNAAEAEARDDARLRSVASAAVERLAERLTTDTSA